MNEQSQRKLGGRVTLCIIAGTGSFYTNDFSTVEELRTAIDLGSTINIWWYQSWGQRYSEKAWFAVDDIKQIRTESDD